MAQDRNRRKAKQASRVKRKARRYESVPEDVPLLREARQMTAHRDPVRLLMLVSMLMSFTDPRSADPLGALERPNGPPRADLVGTFIDVCTPETTALLTGFVALIGDDEMLRGRIRRELAQRPKGESWLDSLAAIEVYRAVEMTHILGDGENVILGVRLADGAELTYSIYIDHNLGTLVKDAMVIPEPVAAVLDKYMSLSDDPDNRWQDIDLADARARVEQAVATAAMTYPPYETDTWPGCRAMVEWALRAMPAGGPGYPDREWNEAEFDGLADRFFASTYGAPFDDPVRRDLLASMIWYAIKNAAGDPRHWSSVKAELVLIEGIARTVIAPPEFLTPAPELLKAFVRFVHAENGVRDDLTADTLAALDGCAPEYRRIIDSALFIRGDEDITGADMVLWDLADQVGGADELDRLDETPLPDEPFCWSGIAEDIVERVREVLDLADGCCDALLDVEYRTACRRFLARVACGDPEVFRRKAKTDTAAAAIVWVVGKANDLFGHRRMKVSTMMGHFGLKGGAMQRGSTFLRAGGFAADAYDVRLGSPEFLTSATRAQLIRVRNSVVAQDY